MEIFSYYKDSPVVTCDMGSGIHGGWLFSVDDRNCSKNTRQAGAFHYVAVLRRGRDSY